ncbi:hypothetical protein FACS189499_08410 [Clostridia bacterium]|nr:hypothetical protein FACS189499_08410 [Clostridia bacterium]
MNRDINNEALRAIPEPERPELLTPPKKRGFPLFRATLLCLLVMVIALTGFFATAPAYSDWKSISFGWGDTEPVREIDEEIDERMRSVDEEFRNEETEYYGEYSQEEPENGELEFNWDFDWGNGNVQINLPSKAPEAPEASEAPEFTSVTPVVKVP